ncbi:MAG TPA: aromatic ring-hydroxylating dioxygenase subunit alpha [Polyangiaceae bacterium]|nr:aromatic ring-hydroxylating dioxygenase subunit alpha [Polyangiaceae bacterium]
MIGSHFSKAAGELMEAADTLANIPERLIPPPTKGHLSVARLSRFWYVACRSRDLGQQPIRRTVLGVPLVLFRSRGDVGALLDRCPHRNVPLSLGKVVPGGELQCKYHGWQFDRTGRCTQVPGLEGEEDRERRAPACQTREHDGLVWVWPELDATPSREPFAVPPVPADGGYLTVLRDVSAKATLHATLENALDVPHTAFLHRGLFRGKKKNEIRALCKRRREMLEVEYLGEPRPEGLVGRLLSPSGGTVEHWDRFFLPSIAQVEYRLGPETHFRVTAFGTPVSDFETRLFSLVQFKSLLPAPLVRPLLEPIALSIFRQDARILEAQSKNIAAFGGEQFMSTELDLIGPSMWRMLKQAESENGSGGASADEDLFVVEKETRFWA